MQNRWTDRQTQDPEAAKLLQDHWANMQSNMQMMHGMDGAGRMGCCAWSRMMGRPDDGARHDGRSDDGMAKAIQTLAGTK